MSESFKVYRAHKMADWLEAQATEWATDLVLHHFRVGVVEELSREQIGEVVIQYEDLDEQYGDAISIGFLNVIRTWENENDDYIL